MAITKFNSVQGFSVGEPGEIVDVINNIGNVTATNLTVVNQTDLGPIGNITITGGTANYILKTDGTGNLTWVDPLTSSVFGTNTQIQFNDAGSLGSSSQLTFNKTTNTLSTGNVNGGNLVSANYFTGTLTTASQPNVTSVGVLTGLTVEGDTSITGNLTVQGTFDYINSTTTYISDPITEQGGGANGAALTSDDTRDRGSLLHYYTTEAVDAFMGWDNSNAEFAFGSNVSVTDNIVTFNKLGNIRANVMFANLEGTLRTSAQPNITSVGTLTGLAINGNLSISNTSATNGILTDNLYHSNGQPWDLQQPAGSNTEIVFNLDDNFGASANFTFNKDTNTLSITDGNVNTSNVNATKVIATGNVTGGNLTTAGNLSVIGNATVGNISTTTGIFTGNITTLNANLGNLARANFFSGTLTTASQPNITTVGTLAGLSIDGSDLLLANANLHVAGASKGIFVDNLYYANGSPWDLQQPSGSNTEIVFNLDGNFGASSKFTFDKDANVLTVTGNIVASNANLGNATTSNYFIGKFDATSSSQPNIHTVGTLTDLTVTGDITASSNVNVTGNVAAAYFVGNLQGNVDAQTITRDNKNVPTFVSSATKPTSPQLGDQWYDNAHDVIYQYIYDGSSYAWIDVSSGYISASSAPVGSTLVLRDQEGNVYANAFVGNRLEISEVGNLYVPGGVLGQAITTDGAGNLTWTTITTSPSGVDTHVQFNDNGTFAGSANFTFDKTSNTLSVTKIVANGASLTSLTGANVTGEVNFAATANSVAGANVSGEVDFAAVANSVAGANVSGEVNFAATANSVAGANVTGQVNFANVANNVAGANVSGEVDFAAVANSVASANIVGQVANSLVAGTVYTNAQPNITSVGTLADLTVTGATATGDMTVTGNLIVNGTTQYANVSSFNVKDPIIEQGGNPDGAALTGNDGKDRGQLLHYYTGTSAIDAFMGWDNSNGEFALGSNVVVANDVVTFNSLGNLRVGNLAASGLTLSSNLSVTNANLGNLATANFFSGNGSLLTSIVGSTVTGQVANSLVAGTVYTNAQPNITSVGTLYSLSVTGNVTAGNANLGNLASANFFSGNGSLLSSLTGANVTGQVNFAATANSVAGANVSGQVNFAATANSVAGANVSGQVANSLVAGTVYTNAQPNITSVGTLSNLTSNGTVNFTNASNVTLGAVDTLHISGGATGQYLYTNGSGTLAWGSISQSSISNGTSNIAVLSSGNINLTSAGNTSLVVTGTGVNVAGTINSTGNLTAPNASLGNSVTANFFIGSGNNLSNIQAANITGTVANANYAAYAGNVTVNAQPNITSVGTLTSLNVTGNISAGNISATNGTLTGNLVLGGNLTVSGTTTYVNSTVITYVDPIIELNTAANGSPLSTDSNKDSGFKLNYFDTSAKTSFFGRVDSTGYFEYFSTATETTGTISGTYGVIKADRFVSANTTGAPFVVNSTTRVANLNVESSGLANTVNDAAQPNITSVGILTSLAVTGNVTAGNASLGNLVTANFFTGNGSLLSSLTGANVTGQVANSLVAGTVYTNAQPNITSVGTLSSLSVSGQTNLGAVGNVLISGGTSGYVLTTNGAGDLAWAPSDTSASASFVSMVKTEFIGNGTKSSYTLARVPASIDAVTVNIDGIVQLQSSYALSGATIYFSSAPSDGQRIEFTVHGVVPLEGVNTQVYFNDAGNIGSSANFAFNNTTNTLSVDNFVGNGAGLTSITADTAVTVTGSDQPNITSVGTLTSLTVSGHIIPTADITYDLGSETNRFRDLWLSGNTLQIGDATIDVVGNSLVLTNPIGGQFIVDGSNAAYASLAAYVTESNQSNITQVGNLISLNVAGNIVANNISTVSNLAVDGGYLSIGGAVIGVNNGNAGIFTTGISNVNIGLTSNVTIGSSNSTTTLRGAVVVTNADVSGNLSANIGSFNVVNAANINVTDTISARYIKVGDLYSSRAPVYVTNNTVIDTFNPNTYRSAKYTIRVNSDDGYQAAEVLLIHDGTSAYVTIYGSLSTIGHDIVLFTADVNNGAVELYATTSSTGTTVNLLGTYVAD